MPVDRSQSINLRELTGGDCMRLRGLCEFQSCRFHCKGGGCAIKIAGNGWHRLDDVAALVGISRVGVQDVIMRGAAKMKEHMKGWKP